MAVVMSSHDLALVELTIPGWPCSPRSTIYQYDSFHSLFFIRGVVSYPFSLSERSSRLLRNGPEPVVHRVLAGTAKQPSDEKANYVLACVLECVFLNSPLIFSTCYLARAFCACYRRHPWVVQFFFFAAYISCAFASKEDGAIPDLSGVEDESMTNRATAAAALVSLAVEALVGIRRGADVDGEASVQSESSKSSAGSVSGNPRAQKRGRTLSK